MMQAGAAIVPPVTIAANTQRLFAAPPDQRASMNDCAVCLSPSWSDSAYLSAASLAGMNSSPMGLTSTAPKASAAPVVTTSAIAACWARSAVSACTFRHRANRMAARIFTAPPPGRSATRPAPSPETALGLTHQSTHTAH